MFLLHKGKWKGKAAGEGTAGGQQGDEEGTASLRCHSRATAWDGTFGNCRRLPRIRRPAGAESGSGGAEDVSDVAHKESRV